MKWIEPAFSKERVKKAGKILCEAKTESDEFKEAAIVFANWRSSHAFPMQIMLDLLRKNALKIDKKAIAVQRLKRAYSIIYKLLMEENMSLSRMEDIGGCRVVLSSTSDVKELYQRMKKCRTKHDLYRERDYISSPKESGYRGVHMVYKYRGSRSQFDGLSVELQLRSKIQHSWATAVEVVGTFTRQALKASHGDERWLNFFRYSSAEFAKLEKTPVETGLIGIDTATLLKQSAKELDLTKRLSSFRVAVEKLGSQNESASGYFVLLLDLDKRVIRVSRFNENELQAATDLYDSKEDSLRDDHTKNLVLVSAKSLRELKKAYPNYFSDTNEFERYIHSVSR